MELAVLGIRGGGILCRVVRGGVLRAHQGVNLPGVRLRAPSLTRKDVLDLRFGLRRGVDYVALSFVRSADDLRHARRVLRRLGRAVPIVAKLEKAEAIANLARHARANRVSISVTLNGGNLRLRVEDDGDGFSVDAPRDGKGLTTMAQRAAELKASLAIRSEPGVGTALELDVPLDAV